MWLGMDWDIKCHQCKTRKRIVKRVWSKICYFVVGHGNKDIHGNGD